MARTALFERLRRTLLRADYAERTGVSTSELRERREEHLSRRALLRGAGSVVGAAAAARVVAACGGDVDAPESYTRASSPLVTDARIVIVGGGLAGVTCAYRLMQKGVAAKVYDANDRVGGRTFTHRSAAFPNKVELGGEFIDTAHTTMQTLAAELGLTLIDVVAATATLEPERYHVLGQRYTEDQIIEQYRPIAKQLRADFRSIGQPRFSTYDAFTPRGRELDLMSISDWLDDHGVGGAIRKLLDVGYTSEYGGEIDTQSFLNLLYLISYDPDPFLIFGDSDERFTIAEGNDAVATRMNAQLATPVELGHQLEQVKEKNDGTLAVTFRKPNGATVTTIADKLVLAIPFNQLRKVDLRVSLSPAKTLSLRTLGYGTNAKVMAGVSRRPWVAQGSTGTSFHDVVFQESWDSSRGVPTTGAAITHFSGGNFGLAMGQGTADFQAKRFLNELDVVFPGSRAAYTGASVRMHWPTAKYFEGSYAVYAPGNYTTFVGSEAEIEGNVHFCGEHTSTDFQGYMEGAAESGERVAKEIRKALRQAV